MEPTSPEESASTPDVNPDAEVSNLDAESAESGESGESAESAESAAASGSATTGKSEPAVPVPGSEMVAVSTAGGTVKLVTLIVGLTLLAVGGAVYGPSLFKTYFPGSGGAGNVAGPNGGLVLGDIPASEPVESIVVTLKTSAEGKDLNERVDLHLGTGFPFRLFPLGNASMEPAFAAFPQTSSLTPGSHGLKAGESATFEFRLNGESGLDVLGTTPELLKDLTVGGLRSIGFSSLGETGWILQGYRIEVNGKLFAEHNSVNAHAGMILGEARKELAARKPEGTVLLSEISTLKSFVASGLGSDRDKSDLAEKEALLEKISGPLNLLAGQTAGYYPWYVERDAKFGAAATGLSAEPITEVGVKLTAGGGDQPGSRNPLYLKAGGKKFLLTSEINPLANQEEPQDFTISMADLENSPVKREDLDNIGIGVIGNEERFGPVPDRAKLQRVVVTVDGEEVYDSEKKTTDRRALQALWLVPPVHFGTAGELVRNEEKPGEKPLWITGMEVPLDPGAVAPPEPVTPPFTGLGGTGTPGTPPGLTGATPAVPPGLSGIGGPGTPGAPPALTGTTPAAPPGLTKIGGPGTPGAPPALTGTTPAAPPGLTKIGGPGTPGAPPSLTGTTPAAPPGLTGIGGPGTPGAPPSLTGTTPAAPPGLTGIGGPGTPGAPPSLTGTTPGTPPGLSGNSGSGRIGNAPGRLPQAPPTLNPQTGGGGPGVGGGPNPGTRTAITGPIAGSFVPGGQPDPATGLVRGTFQRNHSGGFTPIRTGGGLGGSLGGLNPNVLNPPILHGGNSGNLGAADIAAITAAILNIIKPTPAKPTPGTSNPPPTLGAVGFPNTISAVEIGPPMTVEWTVIGDPTNMNGIASFQIDLMPVLPHLSPPIPAGARPLATAMALANSRSVVMPAVSLPTGGTFPGVAKEDLPLLYVQPRVTALDSKGNTLGAAKDGPVLPLLPDPRLYRNQGVRFSLQRGITAKPSDDPLSEVGGSFQLMRKSGTFDSWKKLGFVLPASGVTNTAAMIGLKEEGSLAAVRYAPTEIGSSPLSFNTAVRTKDGDTAILIFESGITYPRRPAVTTPQMGSTPFKAGVSGAIKGYRVVGHLGFLAGAKGGAGKAEVRMRVELDQGRFAPQIVRMNNGNHLLDPLLKTTAFFRLETAKPIEVAAVPGGPMQAFDIPISFEALDKGVGSVYPPSRPTSSFALVPFGSLPANPAKHLTEPMTLDAYKVFEDSKTNKNGEFGLTITLMIDSSKAGPTDTLGVFGLRVIPDVY